MTTTYPDLRTVPLLLRPLCRGPWRALAQDSAGRTQHCCWRRATAARIAADWKAHYPKRDVSVRLVGSRREVRP